MARKIIATDGAPKAIGPYHQAVEIDSRRLLFISGQIGLDPRSMTLVSGGIETETAQTLKNIQAIVTAAGGSLKTIVKTTILLTDIDDFAAVNSVYATFFPDDPPARATFAVTALPRGAKIEIDAVAAL
jgi:2-iminobutanoate/2-iminopropanoate deaminase